MILAGLLCGPTEPKIHLFLNAFVEKMQSLSQEGTAVQSSFVTMHLQFHSYAKPFLTMFAAVWFSYLHTRSLMVLVIFKKISFAHVSLRSNNPIWRRRVLYMEGWTMSSGCGLAS